MARTRNSSLFTLHPSLPDRVVRPLASVDEYRRCQEIQRRAWDIKEEGYVMPVSLLVSVQKHGGLVLGAFENEDMLGFAFAFLAQIGSEPGLYSQLTGVLPEQQGKGIGFQLKQGQREEARRRGLRLIAWAFDPLQASNAAFNLHKLGAQCRRYEVDMYGSRSDPLNAGLATDRLIAEWRVEGETKKGPDGESATENSPTRLLRIRPDGGWPRPERAADAAGERLELDIPTDIFSQKRARMDLAILWQLRVREAFADAFGRGYVATDFSRAPDGCRSWYVLERQRDEN